MTLAMLWGLPCNTDSYTFLNEFEAGDKVAAYTIKEPLLLVAFFNKSTFLIFLRK
ncbi:MULTISPECIES: hypothetical protein [Lysinibacillus]|uniref:hypothetical protein n=1 Tax=Lysinibacillus TaxID=400634 RepID=UPI002173F27F|nr:MULTISPECIES: hypothetical protein [Lysinibacillus]MBX8945263.1 hypothetical protein [Lysinibacillus sp. K60]WDU79320.1 hypothetical protein PSR12_22330 [Lysinibacillus sp. G01H]